MNLIGILYPRLTTSPSASDRHRQHIRPRNIMDADEVAHLFSAFEEEWSLSIDQSRCKDSGHAGVRIGQRLSPPIGIKNVKRRHRNAIRTSIDQAQFFLVPLRKCVDRIDLGGFVSFVGRGTNSPPHIVQCTSH